MTVGTESKVRRDTPTMRLATEKLTYMAPCKSISVPVTVPQGGHGTLRDYLVWAREQKFADGSSWTWDDIAFDLRTKTDLRIVRESVRQWAVRYGLIGTKDEKAEGAPAEV